MTEDPRIEAWRLERFREIRPDLAEVMVERFAATGAERIREAEAALAAGDSDAARLALHALKGSAATVGAALLSRLAEEQERRLEAGDPDAGLDRLARELPETLRELRRILDGPEAEDPG